MRTKITGLLPICLALLVMVLTSCTTAPAQPTTPETVVGTTTPTQDTQPVTTTTVETTEMATDTLGRLVEKPKYGDFLNFSYTVDPLGFDQRFTSGYYCWTMDATNDQLIIADWAKADSGTKQITLTETTFPEQEGALRGMLAESWELPDPQTIIYHIRHGVYFQNKPPVNGRELTSADVAFSLKRMVEPPNSYYVNMPFKDIWEVTTPDKYTVVVKFKDYSAIRFIQVSYYPYIIAPETVQTNPDGLKDWKNAVGTGPFYLTDFVPGSGMRLVKNANYWDTDPFFPENKLPYIDGLNGILIPDTATAIAAFRTGKLDTLGVPWQNVADIKRTNPLANTAKYLNTSSYLRLRVDCPPFDNEKVRDALNMAIDREVIMKDFWGGNGSLLQLWLVSTYGSVYTPFDQLPPNVKSIYTLNVDGAKKLLAEAGYLNGFKTEIVYSSASTTTADLLALVKNQFAAINVELILKPTEPAALNAMITNRQYYGMAYMTFLQSHPLTMLDNSIGTKSNANSGLIYDPKFDSGLADAMATPDLNERNTKIKALNVYMLSRAWVVELPGFYTYGMWQPWLKGFHGEYKMGLYSTMQRWKYVWLDKELKKQMIGK